MLSGLTCARCARAVTPRGYLREDATHDHPPACVDVDLGIDRVDRRARDGRFVVALSSVDVFARARERRVRRPSSAHATLNGVDRARTRRQKTTSRHRSCNAGDDDEWDDA